ncbi:ABC transporter permease [Paenibacillus frigoriresistens]|uniref:ABC transporter permease n=1 Tax=Paenibacillus alginolyticus TaxID=59839 RepID=UPI0015646B95|nr:ABC transporter permease [Paenibacillus frigoriresistens]NRF95106.1 ABC transporter permease [Paenibacillus frigoriresistens]
METLRKLNVRNMGNYLNMISVIILVGLFTAINPNFLNAANMKNILMDISPLLVMSAGVTFVLLIGSVDLSIGAICSCACVMTGMWIPVMGNWIIPVVILFGLFAGALNGFIFTKLKITSFIVTLCTMSIWQCVALLISQGAPRGIPINMWKYIQWAKISFGIVPILFVISLVVWGVFYFIQVKTVFGKTIYAVGANERAANLVGLDLVKAKIITFMLSGAGAALGGMIFSLKLKASIPTIGNPYTLMTLAAVVLGGTALTGGKGSVIKTIIGVMLVIIIQNGLNVVAVDAFLQQIVFGMLIIFAVYLNVDKSGRDVIIK